MIKALVFLYINNVYAKKIIMENSLLTTALKTPRSKTKETKDIYKENFKILMKVTEDFRK